MAAIYMWFEQNVQIFTTTPYPIEVIDKVEFSVSFASGFMQPIPQDSRDFNAVFLGGVLTQILLSAPPVEDARDFSAEFLGGVLTQILLSAPPVEDERDFAAVFLGGVLEDKLVTADTPDEKLQMNCSFDGSSSSMTSV